MMFVASKLKLSDHSARCIDLMWGDMAQKAYKEACDFIESIDPNISRGGIKTTFAKVLMISVIHRLAQTDVDEQYLLAMLNRLESLGFTVGSKVFRESYPTDVFTPHVMYVLNMIGEYLMMNTDYVQKAPSMLNLGFWQKKKLSWALKADARGLTLKIGDYSVGYALLAAYYVDSYLTKYINLNDDKKRMSLYSKIDEVFNRFYVNVFEDYFDSNGNVIYEVKDQTKQQGQASSESRLKELKALLESGLITQEDFDSRKKAILDSI